MGRAVKACPVAVMMIGLLPALARAQSGTDVPAAIPVHPDVPTILELPDAITRVWSIDRGELMVQGVGKRVYVRPRPDTPAGVEALVEVETATLHRIFLVRVVAHAADAKREVVVPAAASCVEPAGRDAAPAAPTLAAPAARTPACAVPGPTEAEPTEAGPAEAKLTEPTGAPDDERAALATMPPRFDLSAHAMVGMGFTGMNIAGYGPGTAFRSHHVLGLRLTGAPRGRWWSLQADISGERLAGPMTFEQGPTSRLAVTGARLRAEVGMTAGIGTTWIASLHTGIGVQAHLRRTLQTSPGAASKIVESMERNAVLVLGVGLRYRARRALPGLEFQVRQGVPDDYFSMAALLTVSLLLDQGE